MLTTEKMMQACNVISEANSALSKLFGRPVELRLVKPELTALQATPQIIKKVQDDHVTNTVVEVVCEYFMLSPAALRVKSRSRTFVDARKICAYLLDGHVNDINDFIIAKMFDCDRSTVSYYRATAADLILTNKDFKYKYGRVLKLLKERLASHD